MATPREWAEGYLGQARADLQGARIVDGSVPSVYAMLLQMAFEKLAKAALLRSGAIDVATATRTHRAASRMVQALRLQRRLMDPLGGPVVWEQALWAVETLERLHPSLAQGGAQLEYPWEDANGSVAWPERHLSFALGLANPTTTVAWRVLRFATTLSERFDQIFP